MLIFIGCIVFFLTILMIFCIASSTSIKKNKLLKLIFSFIIILPSLYFISHLILLPFTGDGVNEVILFHIFNHGLNFGFSVIGDHIYSIVTGIIILLLIAITVYFLIGKINFINLSIFIRIPCFIIAFIASFYINPSFQFIKIYFNLDKFLGIEKVISQEDLEKFNEQLAPEKDFKIKNKKNIVFLYMESYEQEFFNQNMFPSQETADFIKFMKENGIWFSDMSMHPGATYTMAAMISSQCGFPYQPRVNYSDGPIFKNITCLSDVLAENNYKNIYIGGADIRFAGKDRFFKSHSFTEELGTEEVKQRYNIKNTSSWGIYDDDLLNVLWEKFQKLSQKNQPFMLMSITLDTHPPINVASPSCNISRDKENPNKYNYILDNISCNARLITEFLKKIKSSPYWDNTYVVLASDHLPPFSIPKIENMLLKSQRKNTLAIVGGGLTSRKINKQGLTIDIGASILDLLGNTNNARLGLGVSMFSQQPSIQTKFTDIFNLFSSKWRDPINKITNANLEEAPEYFFILKQGEIKINNNIIYPPYLVTVNKKNELILSKTTKFRSFVLMNLASLGTNRAYFFVHQCKKIQKLNELKRESYNKPDVCYAYGRIGSNHNEFKKIEKETKFKKDILFNYLAEKIDNKLVKLQKTKLNEVVKEMQIERKLEEKEKITN